MEALMACYQHGLLYLEALADAAPGQSQALEAAGEEGGGNDGRSRPAAALPGSARTPVALAN